MHLYTWAFVDPCVLCVCACVRVLACAHTRALASLRLRVCARACACVPLHACASPRLRLPTPLRLCLCACACGPVCICFYVSVHTRICGACIRVCRIQTILRRSKSTSMRSRNRSACVYIYVVVLPATAGPFVVCNFVICCMSQTLRYLDKFVKSCLAKKKQKRSLSAQGGPDAKKPKYG